MSAHRIFSIIAAAFVSLTLAEGGASLRTAAAQGAPQQIETIFDNGNIDAVQNRPTRPTIFTVSEPTRIVTIRTYHWNNGRGARPGMIALRSSRTGQTFGPWQAVGQPGQGGVPNAYWIATANVDLAPGEYTIVDSNPSTWAQNWASGGIGMVSVQGYPLANAEQSQELGTIFDNGNIYAVQNRPTRPTIFTVSEPARIVTIRTYHWNYGRGARPGMIALRSSRTGQTFGPWQAVGQPGQGGVPNAYWIATANVDLAPGEYTIVDSNPSTWAQNSASDGVGMVSIQGYPIANPRP